MEAITVEIAKLDLKAGEMLAIMVPQMLNMEQRANLREMVRHILPDGVKAVVLDGGVTLAKVQAADVIDAA